MPKATSLREAKAFADAVTAIGGAIPDTLGNLLAAHDLLSRPGPTESPERAILTAALDGSLDGKALQKLLPAAATAAQANTYRAELAARAEHTILGAIHRALETGCADQILASMRPAFDEHAEAIAHARALISAESTAEHVIASGTPEMVTAWQDLDNHIRVITRIAAVASQFGARPSASFPQVAEFNAGDGYLVEDRALMCCDGGLIADSALFRQPDQGHRTSPWFRLPLKLHTVASARHRYNQWAADEFDAQHSGPRGGWVGEDGVVHEHPAPPNPYRQKVTT